MIGSRKKYKLPPNNPFLIQNSIYPMVHFNSAQTDVTSLAIDMSDRPLKPSKISWLPGVSFIGAAHKPYPQEEHAIFFSGGNRIGKIRITNRDFTMIDEIAIPGYEEKTLSTTQIRQIAKQMQKAGNNEQKYLPPFLDFLKKTDQSSATLMNGIYSLMDNDGNYYAGWGTSIYKVADLQKDDIRSPIQIVKSFDLRKGLKPEEAANINRLCAQGMTYDGYLVVAMPGILAILDRNLENMQYILLRGEAVDNGISIDGEGGIYCVTSKYMRKLVWDGQKLSDSEEDGAWKSEYDYIPNPKAFSRGAGNTPTLMGFGPEEDKLVIIADAGDPVKIVAFWRNKIPQDFKQKPETKSRRIADQLALTIDVPATIEWSPQIYGNGVMMMASAFPEPVRQKDGKVAIFETILTSGVTREAPVGAEKWSWDSKTRAFKSDWTVNYPLQSALYPVSARSNTVALAVLEKGLYSLVYVDWETGEEVGKIILGNSPIFNTAGGFFIPINESEIFLTGVFGPVKITVPAK